MRDDDVPESIEQPSAELPAPADAGHSQSMLEQLEYMVFELHDPKLTLIEDNLKLLANKFAINLKEPVPHQNAVRTRRHIHLDDSTPHVSAYDIATPPTAAPSAPPLRAEAAPGQALRGAHEEETEPAQASHAGSPSSRHGSEAAGAAGPSAEPGLGREEENTYVGKPVSNAITDGAVAAQISKITFGIESMDSARLQIEKGLASCAEFVDD